MMDEDGLPNIEPSSNLKLKPGLSSYGKNPPAAQESISKLIDYAKKIVPMSQWKDTPVHVQATAGLRSIPENEAEQVLEEVRNFIENTGFRFERKWAKVISGSQEGINGWMAANYLLGVFSSSSQSEVAPKTTGVVEMGGTSLQLTYVPENPQATDRMRLTEVSISGHKYYLYTHSYLHYGLQAAEKMFQRVNIDIIEENGNPCYAAGYRHSSTGSFNDCMTLVAHMMDKTTQCQYSSCSFNGVYQPPLSHHTGSFIAIENFYYTLQFFKAHDMAGPSNTNNRVVASLKTKGHEFCGMPWTDLSEMYSSVRKDELASYCFAAAYEASMLEHGLGFTHESDVKAVREITGKPIDWALGAVLGEILNMQTGGDEGKSRVLYDPPNSYDMRDQINLDQTNELVSVAEVAGSTTALWYVGALVLFVAVGLYGGWKRIKTQKNMRSRTLLPNVFSRV